MGRFPQPGNQAIRAVWEMGALQDNKLCDETVNKRLIQCQCFNNASLCQNRQMGCLLLLEQTINAADHLNGTWVVMELQKHPQTLIARCNQESLPNEECAKQHLAQTGIAEAAPYRRLNMGLIVVVWYLSSS